MISRTGKYALRILGHLVDHSEERIQGREIASITGIPGNYLSKILNQLRKRGFVESQKGWGGGFVLRKQALNTPISEVLQLFEGAPGEHTCVFGIRKCDANNPCPLHDHWERIQLEYETMLNGVLIRDLRSVMQTTK
jgi:Rrf2 family transcriptional regulator, iron-sulfur cluster assembly transcription factor